MNRSISFSISLRFSKNTTEKTFLSSIVALIMPNKYHLLTRLGQQPAATCLRRLFILLQYIQIGFSPLITTLHTQISTLICLFASPRSPFGLKGFWASVLFLNWNDLSLMVFSASFFGLSFTRIILNKQSLIQLKEI